MSLYLGALIRKHLGNLFYVCVCVGGGGGGGGGLFLKFYGKEQIITTLPVYLFYPRHTL